jgi:glycosyltransferase involved in cell wall biosynthesis
MHLHACVRIAQIAPLYESVPPRGYGGTERVVSYLTEELVRRGHDVTLFASGDSQTAARLLPGCPSALRLAPEVRDPLAHHLCMLDEVLRLAPAFDVMHFHLEYLGFPFAARATAASVTTLHGRLDLPDLPPVFRRFSELPLVSVSDSQRRPLPDSNWMGTVYHGMPGEELRFHPHPGKYLAFLGRISPEKRVDRAIAIARRVGLPLRIAAKIDATDRSYYQQVVRPLLRDPLVEYVGEIGPREKEAFLGGALAVLFPVDWPEPFGLVMIEAMACGTPVIAFRAGSVPEVMRPGVSGFVVEDVEAAVQALVDIERFDRAGCRAYFEARFTVSAMTDGYLAVYRDVGRALADPTSALAAS